ncbi:MAG: hypothetical protein OXI77_18325 [Chloroflexota bacterium]|nr:hypothetical protein [Chloroflexota bacterium]MDE2909021.1 hypothetical protein [Chloroflexota bacterium]
MNEKTKRVPPLQRLPIWFPWAAVFVVVIAGVVYAAHENQMRAERIITELGSELAVARADLQLAYNELETTNAELEDSIALAENAIVANLFEPVIMHERRNALIDIGVVAESCAVLPFGIGFNNYLYFDSNTLLGESGPEYYIRYNLRSKFANSLKVSGRYERVDDITYVRKDILDVWSPRQFNGNDFVHNYCKSLEMEQ